MWGLSFEETIRLTKHSTLVDIETIDTIDSLDKDLVIFSPVRTNKHVTISNYNCFISKTTILKCLQTKSHFVLLFKSFFLFHLQIIGI